MIKKILLGLIAIIIVADLAVIGIYFSKTSKKAPITSNNSKNIYTSNDAAVSPVDARTIVENKANGGTVTSLNYDKNTNQYNVTVETLTSTYNATVNGTTGAITSFVNDNKKPSVDLNFTPNSSTSNGSNYITASQAVEAFNKAVPNGQITQMTYDIVNVEPQYDANIVKDNKNYSVAINASTGAVISNTSVPLTSK